MRKFISVILSLLLTVSTFTIYTNTDIITAKAADYATTLREKGFPESYIDSLVALHKKYPSWIFKPLKTGINWSAAIKGERASHGNQLIEKSSYYNDTMFCKCSSCYKNGKYVIREASNWVAASEHAVEYYMDPRNWLNEKDIFQFESTAYDGTQSQQGVEAILDGTWMSDSLITYKTMSGNTKKYDNTTKYSDAIMKAANDSGMSAYYLASKIRQEVGGVTNSAGGASGTNSTYPGIYNYYNIGAYTGALDGLKWASNSGTKEGDYTNCACRVREKATTSSKELVQVDQNTPVTIKSTTSKQADGYKWHNVTLTFKGKSYTGYIRSDLITHKNAVAASYGRPWTNPYRTIYYGAQFISDGYKTQTSGYLQKFNVNPASTNLYTHEYMANVSAAVSESRTTYAAYSKANILSITKTFEIPVFNKMPNDTQPEIELGTVDDLKATTSDSASVTLRWSEAENANGYLVQVYRNGGWQDFATTASTTIRVNGLGQLCIYNFRVKPYATNVGDKIYGEFSNQVSYGTRGYISNLTGDSTINTITLKWKKHTKATSYSVYSYDSATDKYTLYKQLDSNTTTIKISSLKGNTNYKYRIIGIREYKGTTYKTFAANITVKTKNNTVTINSAVSNAPKRITVKWTKLPVSCSGYQVMWSTTSDFSSNYLYSYVKSPTTVTRTISTSQSNRYYYVKVRAYKTMNNKNTYYSWSKTIKVKVK